MGFNLIFMIVVLGFSVFVLVVIFFVLMECSVD